MRPSGSGGARASTSLALLDDAHRHRLRRAVWQLPPRRLERGPWYFHHGPGVSPRISTGRAHGACEANSRREEEAMSLHIVDDEQRRDCPQPPCALRVPATRGDLRRWRSSTMYTDIGCRAPPGISPRGARNATPANSRTDSQRVADVWVADMRIWRRVSFAVPPNLSCHIPRS